MIYSCLEQLHEPILETQIIIYSKYIQHLTQVDDTSDHIVVIIKRNNENYHLTLENKKKEQPSQPTIYTWTRTLEKENRTQKHTPKAFVNHGLKPYINKLATSAIKVSL